MEKRELEIFTKKSKGSNLNYKNERQQLMRNFRFNFWGIIKLKPVWHVEGVWALGVGESELIQSGKAGLLCFGRATSFGRPASTQSREQAMRNSTEAGHAASITQPPRHVLLQADRP